MVAIVLDKYLDKIHRFAASDEMFEVLDELENLDFGAKGTEKQINAAALKARKALAKARGEMQ